MISATVIGNIGKNATTKLVGDSTVVSFTMASNMKKGDQDITTWVSVSLWGDRYKNLGQHLTQGKKVAVTGELFIREYDKDGVTRQSLDLDGKGFEFCDGKPQQQEQQQHAPQQQRRQGPPQRQGQGRPGQQQQQQQRQRPPPPPMQEYDDAGGYDDDFNYGANGEGT